MNLFRRSLAEDSSDRLTHVWSVALFLVLALITWLLPLALMFYQPPANTPKDDVDSATSHLQNIPEYEAMCWCPPEFHFSAISYSNKYCSVVFNKILDSNDTSNKQMHDDIFSSADLGSTYFQPLITRQEIFELSQKDKNAAAGDNKPNYMDESLIYYLYIQAPLTLFLFAIFLKIPHTVWSLLSFCSSFNLDLALSAAVQAPTAHKETRNNVYQNLSAVLVSATKLSQWSLSLSYMVFKIATVFVLLAEILCIGLIVLPEIDDHAKDLRSQSLANSSIKNPEVSQEAFIINRYSSPEELTGYDGRPLVCPLDLKFLNNVQSYSIQCIFSPKDDSSENKAGPINEMDQGHHGNHPQIVLLALHKAVFTAVLAYLVVVTINVLINTLTWVSRLVFGQCGPTKNPLPPMDARLVLAMSRDNAGPLVTQQLLIHTLWGTLPMDPQQQEERL